MSPQKQTLEIRPDNIKVDEILSGPACSWDRRIAADLIAEMETHLAEKITTLPEMRRILAVKGYQGLRRRIEGEVEGKSTVCTDSLSIWRRLFGRRVMSALALDACHPQFERLANP